MVRDVQKDILRIHDYAKEKVKNFEEKLEDKLVNINRTILLRHDRFKVLQRSVEDLYFMMSMFLFIRSLKNYSKKVSQNVKKLSDQNLKFISEWIIKTRIAMI